MIEKFTIRSNGNFVTIADVIEGTNLDLNDMDEELAMEINEMDPFRVIFKGALSERQISEGPAGDLAFIILCAIEDLYNKHLRERGFQSFMESTYLTSVLVDTDLCDVIITLQSKQEILASND